MREKLFFRKAIQLLSLCCIFFLSTVELHAQNTVTIQGQVLDVAYQEPLISVSIVEKGTTNGIITDLDGRYTLTVNRGATIVFSYIGYVTRELSVDQSSGIIRMEEDSKALDEVVVVGYGTQKKVNLSGSVSAIGGEKIAAKPSTDVLSALQGELPGVAVLRSSGQPGSETSGMRIRGFTSVNDTKALVLIDGIEGDINLLNPSDIESISVLKDAASSSIYGSRAAAGVVLVTTKSGKSGKATVSYNGYFGVNTPGNMPERLPAWEEQVFIDESRINTGGSPEWTPEQASWVGNPNFNYRLNPTNNRWDFFKATNWVDEGTRDYTTQQSHAVSVSGGTKETNYLVSANYYTKNGLMKYGPDGNDRYNLRFRLNTELNKYVDFNLNVSYQSSIKEDSPTGAKAILQTLYLARGRQPIYNPEEDINESPFNGDLQRNAIDIMKNGGSKKDKYEAFQGKGTVTLKNFIDGLRINLSASRKAGYYSSETRRRHLVWHDRTGTGIRFQENNPNSLVKLKNSDYQDLFEATVHYDLNLGDHSFNALAGSTYENYRKDEIEGTAKNLNSNDFFSFNYYDTSEATNSVLKDKVEPWSMMSYFGRINYNFKERYLFEANIRYDGSSRLAPESRWKAFPSFSAAWRANEEPWFNVDWIDNMKLRGSWGQLGNGAVLGFYDYLALIESGSYINDKYYYQKTLASKDKTWETIQTTNIGVDLGLLNNRLNVTGEYYWKYNKDMLMPVNLPTQIGIETSNANLGNLKVWGWDFEVSWKDKIKDLNYQVSFNISDSQNELVEYGGTNVIKAGSVAHLQGYPLNTIWGYKTDGYWNSREEYLAYKEANPGYQSFNDGNVSGGDTKYLTKPRINENGESDKGNHIVGAGGGTPEDPGDLIYLGDSNGRYLYGLTLSLQWRNFDFSMMFQGVAKRKMLINAGTLAPLSQTSFMPWTIHRDYSKVDADGNLIQAGYWPRLYNYNNQGTFNFEPSDRWVQDASYIRLKNVTVGYTVPIKKNIMQQLRVYMTGSDLWEHSNLLSVFDPEAGNNVGSNYYPFFRTWTLGVNITF